MPTESENLFPERARCAWTYDQAHDKYDTACGSAYQLTEGNPAQNVYHYCPGCGGWIVVTNEENL